MSEVGSEGGGEITAEKFISTVDVKKLEELSLCSVEEEEEEPRVQVPPVSCRLAVVVVGMVVGVVELEEIRPSEVMPLLWRIFLFCVCVCVRCLGVMCICVCVCVYLRGLYVALAQFGCFCSFVYDI